MVGADVLVTWVLICHKVLFTQTLLVTCRYLGWFVTKYSLLKIYLYMLKYSHFNTLGYFGSTSHSFMYLGISNNCLSMDSWTDLWITSSLYLLYRATYTKYLYCIWL